MIFFPLDGLEDLFPVYLRSIKLRIVDEREDIR